MTDPLPPTDSPAGIADGEIEELEAAYKNAVRIPPCGKWERIRDLVITRDVVPWDTFCTTSGTLSVKRSSFIAMLLNEFLPLIQRLKRAEAERDALSIKESSMSDAIDSLVVERDRLRSALKPFADMAGWWDGLDSDNIIVLNNEPPDVDDEDMAERDMDGCYVSDFRRAAAALADAGEGGGDEL